MRLEAMNEMNETFNERYNCSTFELDTNYVLLNWILVVKFKGFSLW